MDLESSLLCLRGAVCAHHAPPSVRSLSGSLCVVPLLCLRGTAPMHHPHCAHSLSSLYHSVWYEIEDLCLRPPPPPLYGVIAPGPTSPDPAAMVTIPASKSSISPASHEIEPMDGLDVDFQIGQNRTFSETRNMGIARDTAVAQT